MAYCRSIDEIVLSYVISILEDLGDDSNAEENIDVDQFVEMMEAYIPGFSSINRWALYCTTTCITHEEGGGVEGHQFVEMMDAYIPEFSSIKALSIGSSDSTWGGGGALVS